MNEQQLVKNPSHFDTIVHLFLKDMPGVKHNYSYFPIFVDEDKYGISRDALYEKMKQNDVFGRRYFYPLISEFSTYRGVESANKENLPVANVIAEGVICLPMYAELKKEEIDKVISSVI